MIKCKMCNKSFGSLKNLTRHIKIHKVTAKDRIRQEQLENLGWKFIRYRDYIPTLQELKNDIEI